MRKKTTATEKPELTPPQEKMLPEVEAFLEDLGVRSCDSDFTTLRRMVLQALLHGGKAEEAPAPPRWQDQLMERLVARNSSVLDVGCGSGDLLVRLAENRRSKVQGIERDQELVIRCIERGIPVYHGNLERGLQTFCTGSFDYTILEETLQTLVHPLDVLREMLRVGRHTIVSFPNFAHWKVRLAFSLGGRMPKTKSLPHSWFDTPNIHLCSINDFMDWTIRDNVRIVESWVLAAGQVTPYQSEHNLSAEQALFVVEKK